MLQGIVRDLARSSSALARGGLTLILPAAVTTVPLLHICRSRIKRTRACVLIKLFVFPRVKTTHKEEHSFYTDYKYLHTVQNELNEDSQSELIPEIYLKSYKLFTSRMFIKLLTCVHHTFNVVL